MRNAPPLREPLATRRSRVPLPCVERESVDSPLRHPTQCMSGNVHCVWAQRLRIDNSRMKRHPSSPRRGITVASAEGMTGQRHAAILWRRIVWWIRRDATPGGWTLQRRLDPIVAEARTANAKTASGELRLSINRRKDSRLAHRRVVVRTLTVAALVILGIGGASAAMDSGPSSPGPPMQPAGRSTVLTEGIRAIGQSALKQADDRRHLSARHDSKTAARWVGSRAVPTGRRWPFRADPRRWPRLFANTTECSLSLDPITRRHWWQ